MKILMVSGEAAPFSKTGGLADVLKALPEALAKRGHEVCVLTPYYRETKSKGFDIKHELTVEVWLGGTKYETKIFGTKYKGASYMFVENDRFYDRDYLYSTPDGDYPDNAERFGFLSKTAMELAKSLGGVDILHAHDWQAALVPIYKKVLYKDSPFLQDTRCAQTIHNIGYQGVFGANILPALDLPYDEVFHMEALEFYGQVNLLKGGIVYSDVINTVSKGYAKEIQTPEFGAGLEGILLKRSNVLFGILNGADYEDWNPETDKYIVKNFSAKNATGKSACKQDLLKEFGLPPKKLEPIFGFVGRLAEQKGLDILIPAISTILEKKRVNFIILGTGDRIYNEKAQKLSEKFPKRVGVKIAFDNAIAHKIEAGCDFFLMPSKYEPCGLNQMYSLKYGTIPVVRATGGLDDTIEEFDPKTKSGNGFKFYDYTPEALLDAMERAIAVYRKKPLWTALQKNAFSSDFSWDRSAGEYEKMYEEAKKQ